MSTFQLTPRERIIRARIRLLERQPFFGFLALRLRPTEIGDKDFEKYGMTMPTLGVDYLGHLFYNPEYVKKLTDDELEFCVAHEVMHVALIHNIRYFSKKDTMRWKAWNIAGDLNINNILSDASFRQPANTLSFNQPQFKKYKGQITEEIFEGLMAETKVVEMNMPCGGLCPQEGQRGDNKNQDSDGNQNPNGSPFQQKDGNGEKDEAEEERQIKKAIEDWKKAMIEAATMARTQGKLPGSLANLVDILLEPPKVNWKELLFRYVQQSVPRDFTWLRPSKKSASLGIHLPATTKESITIVVVLDVSGSISDKQYVDFLNEMIYIARCFNHVRFHIISCDADVQHTMESVDTEEIIEEMRKRKGYGGTDFRPAFEWVDENLEDARVLIYFTDGYGTFPMEEDIRGRYRTIWVYNQGDQKDPPFGQIIRMEE